MAENIVSIESISKSFGDKELFQNVSFGIHKGDKIGLVGANGCGKTTFLKMLFGVESLDEGRITVRKNIKIAYLSQNPKLNDNLSIIEQILHSDHPHLKLIQQYNQIANDLKFQPELEKEYNRILEEIHRIGAWETEQKVKNFLTKFGMTDFNKSVLNLSGGEKRRIDMARVLMDEPDLLIMDEPTNHLDISTIEWLQNYLASYNGSLIFVTHDRYFLDAISTKIMEIDRNNISFFEGNYSFYLEQKQYQITDLNRKETRRQAQLKKELKWLHRGARARSSKPKNHIDRVRELMDKSYLTDDQELNISFKTHRMGKTILEAHNLSMKYDKTLFSDFSHIFQKKERIGIIGKNGCGKTTLLKLLVNDEELQNGRLKIGINTKFSYFKQNTSDFDEAISVIDYIKLEAEFVRTKDGVAHSAKEMLERFLFPAKMHRNKISSLSGGEKKRLYLLKSLMFGANFMILDEPTNDLDIQTLEILEDYLDGFDGCVLVVSHDRYFLDRVTDYLFIFEEDNIRKLAGNYSDYLLLKRFQEDEKKLNTVKPKRIKKAMKGLNFNEKRELDEIEQQIENLETTKYDLEKQMEINAATLLPLEFKEITDKISEIEEELFIKMERWEFLELKKNEE